MIQAIEQIELEGTVVVLDDLDNTILREGRRGVIRLPLIESTSKVPYDGTNVLLHLQQCITGARAFCDIVELSKSLRLVNHLIVELVIVRRISQESITVRNKKIEDGCNLE